MSSSGTMRATTPLLPWRPAILSPTESLRLRRDINFDLLDDARIDIVSALDPIHRAIAFELQLRELVFVRADDFANLVADRARIDLDVIMRRCQFSQQRLGDFAIGWDDDLTSLGVHDVEQEFFHPAGYSKASRSIVRSAPLSLRLCSS